MTTAKLDVFAQVFMRKLIRKIFMAIFNKESEVQARKEKYSLNIYTSSMHSSQQNMTKLI